MVLAQRLRDALARLNPALPAEALDDAFRKLTRPEGADLIVRNRALHRLLVDGVTVEYRDADGSIRGAQARVIDFDDPAGNDWLAVNQFSVVENKHSRRPDVVLFVNGLPLAVLELKNAAAENATIWSAFQQLQTYQAEVPSLFATERAARRLRRRGGARGHAQRRARVVQALAHHRGRDAGRRAPARAAGGDRGPVRAAALSRPAARLHRVRGRRRPHRQEDGRLPPVPRGAGGGGRDAARGASCTARPIGVAEPEGRYEAGRKPGGKPGDRRVGVVWHTQGSGKSLTMAFYAGRIIREPAMENPTLVVLTDRNDLDDQLFATFSRCRDLLRQPPVQAESRAHLRELLSVAAGGVVFTTIHKFFPEEKGDRHPTLSDRRNIVVIADEAHRSQYDFIDGYARHMRDALPHASFIGFTGTPIELQDANTRAVFGDYISVYDIQRAVQDGATVPIYYESRLAKLALDEAERPKIDPEFEEATEGEEVERKEKLKTKWAQLEAVVGAEKRLELVAKDIVEHFEKRLEAMDGKAMIVCMSRRICVELYREIVKLRPDWDGADDEHGALKVVMTGSASDPADWQPHIRNKPRREALANRFRDPKDPFKLVIVRDMWLTGFDAPSLHTMYIDKPMRGHGLMQAIARVNRVFKDKPGGLVVDYLGLAQELKQALATYTESGGTGRTALDQDEAVAVMLEKYEVCAGLFHGFDWSKWTTGTPTGAAGPAAGRAGAHPGAGERQGPLRGRGARAVAGLRAGGAARRGAAHPRRRGVLPGRAGGARQARAGRRAARGGHRARGAADHLARRGARGRDRHLRRGRAREARHLDPLGGVPGRGARDAPAQPRGRAAAEAAQGRAGNAPAQERRAGAFVRRDAGADDPPLPEPRHRGGAGDRGADRAREGDARGERPRRGAAAVARTSWRSTTRWRPTTAR